VGGICGTHGEGKSVRRFVVGRPERKRPLGSPTRSSKCNVKLDLKEIVIGGENWIRLAQERFHWKAFVNKVMNLRFHKENRLFFDKLSNYQLFKEYPVP
jgi:hypothetical protein